MWTMLETKSVMDVDGFWTDYSMWTDGERFVFVFGDNELYHPDDAEWDFTTCSEEEAYMWFEDYDEFEYVDDGYSTNAPCDTYGMCACSNSCPQYYYCLHS